MAIPVYLQQFKAAGIYRVVFDKSTVLNTDTEILRLVVGYSEKGPFNIPVYVKSVTDFVEIYGDISKKQEKRGIFFHRMCKQALSVGPILCLNLKKFDGEVVDGASISTSFNPSFDPIDPAKLYVEDIYDTTRFWELNAEKLNGLRTADNDVLDQYINICTTNTKATSGTYFIRKASGTKVSGFNLSVSDWYSDTDEMPDFLEHYKNNLMSDFMAEIYVFNTRFNADQVLASSTLKKYFEIVVDEYGELVYDDGGSPVLKLKDHLTDAYGEYVDVLDALYRDDTSGALGHYVGSLIPNFKNKKNQYAALDILFNTDRDIHNMMMSFNTDLLFEDENVASIDLSGRLSIATNKKYSSLTLDAIWNGTAKTNLLGNIDAPIIVNKTKYTNTAVEYNDENQLVAIKELRESSRKVTGTLWVKSIDADVNYSIIVQQVGTVDTVTIQCGDTDETILTAVKLGAAHRLSSLPKDVYQKPDETFDQFRERIAVLGIYRVCTNPHHADEVEKNPAVHDNDGYYIINESGTGTYWTESFAFIDENGEFTTEGPQKVITSISRLEPTNNSNLFTDLDKNMKVTKMDVVSGLLSSEADSVYGSSVTFIPWHDEWEADIINGTNALSSVTLWDNTLYSILQAGDCLLAGDGTTDWDENGEIDPLDGFYDNIYVQEVGTDVDEDGVITKYWIKLTGDGESLTCLSRDGVDYLVRIEGGLNAEMGKMLPQYLEGYTYKHPKPEGMGMWDKLQYQKFILSTLTEYKGLRTALLNKSEIDYRYVVDTFESYVDEECKVVLSYLCKEKQSAFAILNFPSVKTFTKCPYTSFVNQKGVFDVNFVVKGFNKKKPASLIFSLPTDADGASFCAFYTPLKFSDGYVDSLIPSAGLVSNLFMEKYLSREPYYIIAGPNYGRIDAAGLVGPDYHYSQEELFIIEPYGVNCMVYRPNFGTFINANQTAKQTPVSALSKVNVRELVIYLQDEIEKVLQAFQWEFNNQKTRDAILNRANAICAKVAAKGGIQAYRNIMDESNNTPEIIDNEMAVISTHIEPGMGCGKMVQELTLYRTGQMEAMING